MVKTNKEWAKHIIKRFGKKNAYKWANSEIWCPCVFLKYNCNNCRFNKEEPSFFNYRSCQESRDFFNKIFTNKDRRRKVKRMIIKKTRKRNRK